MKLQQIFRLVAMVAHSVAAAQYVDDFSGFEISGDGSQAVGSNSVQNPLPSDTLKFTVGADFGDGSFVDYHSYEVGPYSDSVQLDGPAVLSYPTLGDYGACW